MLGNYIKSKIKSILGFVYFVGVFILVSKLYNMPWSECGYAIALCGFFGLVFMGYDYYRYYEKVNELRQIKNSIPYGTDIYPSASDDIESEYQQIAAKLLRLSSGAASRLDAERTDMKDYYTMWVHQIKTPIAAMDLLIQSSEFDEKAEMKLELMKIEEYVEMVLQYLRLGSEQTDYLFSEQELDPIIRDALKKYSVVFVKKKLRLNYEPVNIRVMTDEKWMSFIIGQVLSNALKYTDSGSISIYIRDEHTLVIEDTGIGIKADDLPRIFDRGYTGYNGRNDKKSTGIGLYLCSTIAKRLGHSMSAESEIGRGTRIMIDLYYESVGTYECKNRWYD